MSGQRPKAPNSSIVEFNEEHEPEIILWNEDKKLVNLCLVYNGEESRDEKFQKLVPIKISGDDDKLDKGNSKECLNTLNVIENFQKQTTSIQSIKKEFNNDIKIITESDDIKKEINTEIGIAEEWKYNIGSPLFQPETIQQDEAQLKSKGGEDKNIPKRENPLVLHQCPECPFQTKYKGRLKSHSIRHKNPDEVHWYSCQECPYKTFRKASLKLHAEIHNSNNLILKCSKCSYEILRPGFLEEHHKINNTISFQRPHCPECSSKTHLPSLDGNHVLVRKNDAFKCSKCSFQSRTKRQLTVHQVKHANIKKWHSCPLCLYKTYKKCNLNRHCRERHSCDPNDPTQIEIFKCAECSYESGSKDGVKIHQLIHDRSSWLQCSECGYKSCKKRLFKKHQMRHQDENGEGWHRCPECSYKTPFKRDLRLHFISHKSADEIRWFECSQCNFKTARKYYLRHHQLKHKKSHEIDWFCCYECSFKTKRKRTLVTHISLKHKKQIEK